MEQITYTNIINKVLEYFPDYQKSLQYFDKENSDSQYIVLGNLSLMAFENIDQREDITLAERLLVFTDKIINDQNVSDELSNLLQVQVFEQLVGSRVGAKLAKKHLHGRSLDLLNQTLEHYYTEEFLDEYHKR